LCILGEIYNKGEIVEKNEQKAFEYYKKSADLGFSESQLEIAYFYCDGIFVEENDTVAAEYFLKAAL
jgi:hypothetical protein